MRKNFFKCGFRGGLFLGFSLALVCIQMFAYSRVSNVLFEGESSAPDHHESFKRGKEVLGKTILAMTADKDIEGEDLTTANAKRQVRDVVLENKGSKLSFPAVTVSRRANEDARAGREVADKAAVVLADETQGLELQKSTPSVVTPINRKQVFDPIQQKVHNEQNERAKVEEDDEGDEADCNLERSPDVISALGRAQTPECKNTIRRTACKHLSQDLYDLSIHNTCPRGISYLGEQLTSSAPAVEGESSGPPIRILYLLIVHGRAVRQVKMLLKALYHRDHHFYIHVDQREDYLYRELLPLASLYPNIHLTPWRLSTIWGGASLLQMLLRAMEDAIQTPEWKWDYVINLSAADYPLKSDQDLRQFLSTYRGKNFVKTHRKDGKRFIQKQGLDYTFVECDNHMWRLGKRPLPPGIAIDGGSDWIILHRDFVRYLALSEEQYLTALKTLFEHTLLPAESFFHTVLRNGNFCTSMITNNLHVLNWKREIGCSCQYKQVVDWCGCSPNDFILNDSSWLMKIERDLFARKFESVVSHEVVLRIDQHVYGERHPDTPGLHSYWESVYHFADKPHKPGDSAFTIYSSFKRHLMSYLSRMDHEKCALPLPKTPEVREVTAYFVSDRFQGYQVTVQDSQEGHGVGPMFQLYLRRQSDVITNVDELEGDVAKRLVSIEVGSRWDSKERMFRDFGGVIGVHNDIVIGMVWKKGAPFDYTVEWIDPAGSMREKAIRVKADTTALTDRITTPKPLRPGIWTVRVVMGKKSRHVLMENKVLVVPLTHHADGLPLYHPAATNGASISNAPAQNGVSEEQLSQWKANVQLEGEELYKFIDSLIGQFWQEHGVCVTGIGENDHSMCDASLLPKCQNTGWSSFSPDLKSDLGSVKPNGYLR